MGTRKEDQLLIRIEKDLKDNFTTINKQEKVNNSEVIRNFIKGYVDNNNTDKQKKIE